MKKLLELKDKEWLTGITEDINNSSSPILSTNTNGVSATDFNSTLQNNGMLSVGCRPFEIKYRDGFDYYSVDDIVGVGFYKTATGPKKYLYSFDGNVYMVAVDNIDNNVYEKRTGDPLSDAATGAEIFEMKDGTQYFLYARTDHIGRNDISGSVFDDTWYALSSSTHQRPMYKFQDRVYFGNENKIGMISEESAALTVSENVLDLPPTETVIDFSQVGKYLVIATDSGEVFFWDTNTDSWQKRHTVQRIYQGLFSIFNLSGYIYTLLDTGLWRMTFSEPPKEVFNFSSDSNLKPLKGQQFTGYSTGFGPAFADTYASKFAYVTDNNGLAVYSHNDGTINVIAAGLPAPDSTSTGWQDTSATVNFHENNAIVSVWRQGLYKFSTDAYDPDVAVNDNEEDARQAQSGVTQAETRIIDLGDTYQINMIEVLLDQAPQTHTDYGNDELVVKARGNTNDTYTTFGTIDTTGESKKLFQLRPTKTFQDDTIQIKLEFEGGNPLVRSVKVFGDNITE